jgi:DnaJ-class molecular chaperone
MNYYDVLGVDKHATDMELKKQYRALSYKYHPDRNPTSSEKMQQINEAYETLKEPDKRLDYDRRANPLDVFFEKLFKTKEKMDPIEELFKDDFKEMTPSLDIKIELTLLEAYNGIQLPVFVKRTIHKRNTREYEQEKIYLDIPKGVDDGEIIKIKEKGHCHQGVYSDLKIFVTVLPHARFQRRGLDLVYTQTITFTESICGFSYSILHLNNVSLKLQSSRGNIIQHKEERVIKNKGMIRGDTGDLIVLFMVKVTEKMSETQMTMLEKVFNTTLELDI